MSKNSKKKRPQVQKRPLQMPSQELKNYRTYKVGGKKYHVPPGSFSGYELALLLHGTLELYHENYKPHISDMILMHIYLADMKVLRERIMSYVQRKRGKLWDEIETPSGLKKRVYPFNEKDAGDLVKAYTQLAIVADKFSLDMEPFGQQVKELTIGIRNLINEHDQGESLRAAVQNVTSTFREQPRLQDWLEAYKPPGRRAGSRNETIDYLCKRAVDICLSQGCRQGDASEILLNELYDLNPESGTIEAKALNKLNEWDNGGGYSENLWRHIRRRKSLNVLMQDEDFD